MEMILMATNNKKCTFPKPGTKFHQLGKRKKGKGLTSAERAKKISEWRKNIWQMNVDNKITLLILLWILDKIILFIMFMFFA